MTYLGTRPILQDELQKYELHHRARIAIKPGITGMWQKYVPTIEKKGLAAVSSSFFAAFYSAFGNVELLFRLMKRCDVNTSSDLAPYLTPLTFNEDVRSLCDQISDNIIMG